MMKSLLYSVELIRGRAHKLSAGANTIVSATILLKIPTTTAENRIILKESKK